MQIGIIGLPKAGKTTLFCALTRLDPGAGPAASSAGGEPRVGSVKVPDARLDRLAALFRPAKVTPATVTYTDVGGIPTGEAGERGLSPALIERMHLMDALIIVIGPVRPGGAPDQPLLDYRSVAADLLVSDLAMIERKIERLGKELPKGRHPEFARQIALMERCRGHLEQETPLRSLALTEGEWKDVKGFHFLSIKPLLLVLNHAEGMDPAPAAEALAKAADARVVPLCGSIEMDIARMPVEDAAAFLQDLGIDEPALEKMIRFSYELLGRISFFTVGEDECRAWTVPSGLKAPEAAGYIHTDLQHGFIRAEVIAWDRLLEAGGYGAARARGLLRLEGRDYVVQDGDVLDVKFRT